MFLNVRAAGLLAVGVVSVAARATTTLTIRSTTDVCGDVDDTLVVPGLFGIKHTFGRIGGSRTSRRVCPCSCVVATDKCICQSQIPTLLKTDPVILKVGISPQLSQGSSLMTAQAVAFAGESTVKKALSDMVCNGRPRRLDVTEISR